MIKTTLDYLSERESWNTIMGALDATANNILAYSSWEPPYVGQKLSLAIVEPRAHPHLKTVLYNVAKLYAFQGVSLFIFHGSENETFVLDIVADWPNVHLINLGTANLRPLQEYSELLCSKDFYNWFKSEYVLIFQTDVLLRRQVDEKWFSYDYVGAPCLNGHTLNGGLSLRHVPFFQKVLSSDQWVPNMAEDIWWTSMCKKYHGALPKHDEASDFSVEAIATSNDPVGLHQIYNYQNVNTIIKLTKCLMPTVIASLTTIPKRIPQLRKTLESLKHQVSWIELNIPKTSKRTGQPYELPDWLLQMPYVDVYEVPHDLGPITKVLPTMVRYKNITSHDAFILHAGTRISKHSQERSNVDGSLAYILVVDDDRIYEPMHVPRLLEAWKPRRVVTGVGASLGALYGLLWSRLTPVKGSCDIVQGFSGYLFATSDIRAMGTTIESMVRLILENKDVYMSDDIVISNMFQSFFMHLYSIKRNGMRETSSQVDALSNENNYIQRIRTVLDIFKEKSLLYQSNEQSQETFE